MIRVKEDVVNTLHDKLQICGPEGPPFHMSYSFLTSAETAVDTAEVATVLAAVASFEKKDLIFLAIDGQNTPKATPAIPNKIECINLLVKL